MQKSFKARLEALERLEARREVEDGRYLDVLLYMRPLDYWLYFESDDASAEDVARITAEYGFDQIAERDRVIIGGGAWPAPSPMPRRERTIHCYNAPDGAACRIDQYDGGEHFPMPGETRWAMAITSEVEALRRAYRAQWLADVIAALDAGALGVRPFDPTCDLRCGPGNEQIKTCVTGDAGRRCDVLTNTLDWHQLRTNTPFCQSSADALAVLRALTPADVWTGHQAVWAQRDALMAHD